MNFSYIRDRVAANEKIFDKITLRSRNVDGVVVRTSTMKTRGRERFIGSFLSKVTR